MISKKTSVVVIGGGPAGAMAAAMLAKNGVEVTLLEKQRFPRYAVGESLIPHFWKFTDLIGASDEIRKAGFIQKGGGAALWNGTLRAMNFASYGHDRPGLHVEREVFDDILLNRAKALGATVVEGCKVLKVDTSSTTNTVNYIDQEETEGSISSSFVIDASGQAAILSKQTGTRNFDPELKFQAFWSYFDQSDYLDKKGNTTAFSNRFSTHPMSLVSGTEDWGWVWQLVLKNKVSVGAIIPKSRIAKFKSGGETMEGRFLSHLAQTPLTSDLLANSNLVSEIRTIRDYAYLPTTLAFDRCFLVGDAVAFSDPINSEGVTMALYSGMLAAWCIQKSLENTTRADFYKTFFVESLKKRLDVFQLLSYPRDKMAPHLLKSCIEVVKQQSEDESNLILAHLMVTNRAKDFPELLDAMNIPEKKGWREIAFDDSTNKIQL